ncbi:hypothetical protein HZB00_04090 [Candidatus Woesearchaeota archaeon]|nr:hypothetical protein [Candidatus Woesearchaeota archaeon]
MNSIKLFYAQDLSLIEAHAEQRQQESVLVEIVHFVLKKDEYQPRATGSYETLDKMLKSGVVISGLEYHLGVFNGMTEGNAFSLGRKIQAPGKERLISSFWIKQITRTDGVVLYYDPVVAKEWNEAQYGVPQEYTSPQKRKTIHRKTNKGYTIKR